jgi:protein-disulfide isomerase
MTLTTQSRCVSLSLSLLVLLLGGCERVEDSSATTDPVRKLIEQRVPQYFQKAANLPATVTTRVTDIKPAPVPGLLSATLELSQGAQTQTYPITVSRDGRYLIQGRIADLTRDPYQENMDKIALGNLPMRGNPEATVTIVEYSDFQCPFCAKAYGTVEEQVLKQYGDRVRLVFKNFPLTSIHPWAESAALASACARQQSPAAFWKLYDFFFRNQKEITPQNLKEKSDAVVREAGLDVATFDTCFDNKTALDQVKAEEREATALGVRSTPTFFINGRKLEGALPFEQFKSAIEQALGSAAATPTAAAQAG